MLIERTLISNSSIGINTYKAHIKMKNVHVSNCTYSSLAKGCVMVTERLEMAKSSIMISESNIIFIGDKSISGLIEDNKCQNYSNLMLATNVNIKMENLSLLTITHNKMYNFASTLSVMGVHFIAHESSLVITKNSMTDITTALFVWMSSFIFNESFVKFVDNEMDSSILFLFHDSIWTMSSDSELQMYTAFGLFSDTNASFSGAVRLVNNTAILDGGVFTAVFSELWFKGALEVVGNRGEVSGGLLLIVICISLEEHYF